MLCSRPGRTWSVARVVPKGVFTRLGLAYTEVPPMSASLFPMSDISASISDIFLLCWSFIPGRPVGCTCGSMMPETDRDEALNSSRLAAGGGDDTGTAAAAAGTAPPSSEAGAGGASVDLAGDDGVGAGASEAGASVAGTSEAGASGAAPASAAGAGPVSDASLVADRALPPASSGAVTVAGGGASGSVAGANGGEVATGVIGGSTAGASVEVGLPGSLPSGLSVLAATSLSKSSS
mmetsp:Transcript_7691/g.17768  ORF Transcript_7691/g.17768 Transcript_7691/m.17768 type:complete len:236 (-) Transcript_7691:2021-2728(-)